MKIGSVVVGSLSLVAAVGQMAMGGWLMGGTVWMATLDVAGASGRGVKRNLGSNVTDGGVARRRLENDDEGESEAEAEGAGGEVVHAEVDGGGEVRGGNALANRRNAVVLRPRDRPRPRLMSMRLPDVCLPPANVQQGSAADASSLMRLFGDSLKTGSGSMHRGILRGLAIEAFSESGGGIGSGASSGKYGGRVGTMVGGGA